VQISSETENMLRSAGLNEQEIYQALQAAEGRSRSNPPVRTSLPERAGFVADRYLNYDSGGSTNVSDRGKRAFNSKYYDGFASSSSSMARRERDRALTDNISQRELVASSNQLGLRRSDAFSDIEQTTSGRKLLSPQVRLVLY
jgi:hypothetical protein